MGVLRERKCVRMIQPINALTPRVGFRGSNGTYGKKTKGLTESQIALINAGGIAAAAGGLTTIVARSYTNSFAHAGVLGIFGAFLTMFFMTPHLIEKIGLNKFSKKSQVATETQYDLSKVATVAKEYAIPVKKMVQFRSEQQA